MNISYIQHKDIDKGKWDQCVKNSFNGMIFSFSWYLDIVCESWDAIVEGDYQRVMPLPYVKKMNQLHIVIPPFVKQLGIFSIDKLSPQIIDKFIECIPPKFKEITLSLNNMNKSNVTDFEYIKVSNHQVDLIPVYDEFKRFCSADALRKIAAAKENNIKVIKKINPKDFMDLLENGAHKSLKFKEGDELKLNSVLNTLTKYCLAEVWGAYDKRETLCCAAFFLMYLNRLSLLISIKTTKGSNAFADYAIIDAFIQDNAGKSITLDLYQNATGDKLEINKGFGCIETISHELHRNNLPFFYKIMK